MAEITTFLKIQASTEISVDTRKWAHVESSLKGACNEIGFLSVFDLKIEYDHGRNNDFHDDASMI